MFAIQRNFLPSGRKRTRKKETTLTWLSEKLIRCLQIQGRERTARAYGSVVRSLLGFVREEDLPVSRLTGELLQNYEEYLLLKGRSLNTVSFYMRNLRAMYNKGVCQGFIDPGRRDLFTRVYTGIQRTPKRSAGVEDIRKIQSWLDEREKKDQSEKEDRLMFAGYYFLFCFYARGMSYVDMAYLRKTDIRGNMLCYRRRKTGQLLEVKLTPELRHILSFFRDYVKDSAYLFPVIRREGKGRIQYENGLRLQNRHLKRLGKINGIRFPLSTHVARHTWATVARKVHIPLPLISESLGHSSEKTTLIYLASFDSRQLDKANRRVACVIKKMC